jgi:PAS domain S-box-containing protein
MAGKPTYEDLKKRVEELERKIADRKRDNDVFQKYTQDLRFLSRTSLEYIEFPIEKSIYQLIGERLKELVGDCVIAINSYDKETDSLCTHAVEGLGKYSKAVLKLIGRNPVGMSFPITNEEARSQLATGKLHIGPQGLYELTFGEIPAGICRTIEDLLSLGDIYAIGFTCKGELFGNAIIITRRGSGGLKGEDIVETFIHQAAVALQRRDAEEALVKARDELERRVENRTADLEKANEQLRLEIEERKRAEKEAFYEQSLMQTLLDNIPDYVYFKDKERRFVRASNFFSDLFGCSLEEIIGKKDEDLFPEAIAKETASDDRHVIETGIPLVNKEEGGKGIVGGEHWVLTTKLPWRDKKGNIIGLFGISKEITDRKRAEEALRESEEKFRTVSEQSPNMIFINKMGKVVYANKVCEEIMGYKRDEFYSSDFDFLCLIAPESVDKIQSAFKRHMNGKEVDPFEYAIVSKEGKRIDAIITTKLMNYEGERAILGIVTDISERKGVEQALRESEESYRYLVENANDIIFKTDETGHFTFFNPIAVKTTEYPPEYLLGRNYLDLIRPDYRKDAEKFYMSQFKEKLPSTYYEFPIITKGGKEIWLGQRAQLVLENGRTLGFHAVARDITERRRMEEALRESEERYRQLVKHAPAGIFEFDFEKQRLVALNDMLYENLGYTKGEIEALDPIKLVGEESRKLYSERLGKMLAGEEVPDTVEYKLRGKGGTELWALVNTKLFSEKGKPRRAMVVAHNITDLKRAEEALRESETRLRSLSSQLMKGQEMERMRLSKELHDELGQALALLKHRIRSIRSKLQKGQSSLQEECEETSRYIDEIIENVRRLSRELSPSILEDLGLTSALQWLSENFDKQYSIMTSLEIDNIDDLFPKEAQTNLYRISQEALTNIAKHAEAKHVSFAVKENEESVSIIIEDEGKGFDVIKVRATHSPEKGLGLDAMEERAHMLGASLHIKSQVGEGTRITLTIPIGKAGKE